MKNHWIVKLRNPYNEMKLVLYADGRVYIDRTGPLVGTLNSKCMKKIAKYINECAHYIKYHGYEVQDKHGFIAKFWDSSNKKRDDLSVKGWLYEHDFLRIVVDSKSYRKLCVDVSAFYALMYEYISTSFADEDAEAFLKEVDRACFDAPFEAVEPGNEDIILI